MKLDLYPSQAPVRSINRREMRAQKLKQRYKIFLNYVLGPALFAGLSVMIWFKVRHQPNLGEAWLQIRTAWSGPHATAFWSVIALVVVNWGLEARKWQILVEPIERLSFAKSVRAVLSGLAFSLFIPNRTGEWGGRMLYMSEGNRLRSVALTIVGSIAQLILTLVAGIAGLIWLKNSHLADGSGLSKFWMNGLLTVISAGVILLILIYYKLAWITTFLERIPFIGKHRFLIHQVAEVDQPELNRVMALSLIRFAVYTTQYILLLYVFGTGIGWVAGWWMVCVLFLVLAIVPTIPIGELGIRGQASIQLFGLLSANTAGIVAAAAGIWFINLILPSLAGTVFMLFVRFFRRGIELKE